MLSCVQRGLRAYQVRGICRIGWIFQLRAFRLHQLCGFVHSLLRRFLPQGPAKEIFTWSVTPTLGPVHMDLLVVSITLGPIGLDVSLLALVGVAIAYYVARSIF